MIAMDDDALVAAVDLVGRTGAKAFEVGYLHDDVPVEEAAWWANAQLRGARITVEGHSGPVEAAEALARRILTGGKCAHCGGLVAMSDAGAVAYLGAAMADGTTWEEASIRAAGQCRWRRVGPRWVRGCEKHETNTDPGRRRGSPGRAPRRHRRAR